MLPEYSPNPGFIDPSKIEEIETKFWVKAGELSSRREDCKNQQDELEKKISELKKKGLNLHTEQVVGEMERQYWRLGAIIDSIKTLEFQLEEGLEKLQKGSLTYNDLDFFGLSLSEESEGKLSKKKAAIRKDEERYRKILKERGVSEEDLQLDPIFYSLSGDIGPTHVPGGPNETRLTTGRNLRKIKSTANLQFNPFNAESEFYHRTADSHGGKVGHGKKGDSYVSKGGKKIRKS